MKEKEISYIFFDCVKNKFITKAQYDLRCKNFEISKPFNVIILRKEIFEKMASAYPLQLELFMEE